MTTLATPSAPVSTDNDTSSAPVAGAGMLAMVKHYLDAGNRSYQTQAREDGCYLITMNLTGNNSSFRTYLDIKISQDRLLVFIESPIKVPENQRSICAEYLMRINYTLALGNFELDFRDGEVRYRMAVDVEGAGLSLRMIETNVMVSAATMDRYFPGLMAVVYGNRAPVEAFEEIRNAAAAGAASPSAGSGAQAGQ